MGAAEAPKSEQIQANVAAALSRLRGELGAASSPVAGTARNVVPKTTSEPAEPSLNPLNFTVTPLNPSNLGPLPAGPVRPIDPERSATVLRPFEPTIAAAMAPLPVVHPAAQNEDTPPVEPSPMLAEGRREPSLSAERAAKSEADLQPDLLSGMEVPPAPPPPLGAFESEDEVSGRGKRMRNRLLVLLVLVAIVGAGAWGYILKHRTAGPVPVISADSTPEKVKPADEGGMQVPNQNVQILDNMNGQTSAQAQDTVLPAPEQPLAPPTADASNSAAPAAAPSNTTSATTASNAPTVTEQAPVVPAPAIPNANTPAPSVAMVPAPAATQSAEATPSTSNTDANGKLTLVAPQTQQAAPQPSPAAPAQPAATPKPAATQTAEAPSTPAPTPTLSTGSARVQLAAVKSPALAKAQWAKLQKAYPDLLGALTLNVEKVDRSGTTLYRVQAGPLNDKAAARDLCVKLAAQKQACLVPK